MTNRKEVSAIIKQTLNEISCFGKNDSIIEALEIKQDSLRRYEETKVQGHAISAALCIAEGLDVLAQEELLDVLSPYHARMVIVQQKIEIEDQPMKFNLPRRELLAL